MTFEDIVSSCLINQTVFNIKYPVIVPYMQSFFTAIIMFVEKFVTSSCVDV